MQTFLPCYRRLHSAANIYASPRRFVSRPIGNRNAATVTSVTTRTSAWHHPFGLSMSIVPKSVVSAAISIITGLFFWSNLPCSKSFCG